MTSEPQDHTILHEDGRILLFGCDRFIHEVCEGDACFVCGSFPHQRKFNDEHIVPRWVLRRFDLFDKEITLPTGERRRYGGYRVPCCEDCNTLLGRTVEDPVSQLLSGDFADVVARLDEAARESLFIWVSLLFLKVHLKDGRIPVHKDRRLGEARIGEAYDWSDLHHIHAVARSTFTGARLEPAVIGSLRLFEIENPSSEGGYDYIDFSEVQTLAVRIGNIGIVATLNDSGLGEEAWSERLDLITGPINDLQLREVGAMFAMANRNLVYRPSYMTLVAFQKWPTIIARLPSVLELAPFDKEEFGETLLYAVRDRVRSGYIQVSGASGPEAVAAAIASGGVRFLTNNGAFLGAHGLRPAVDLP